MKSIKKILAAATFCAATVVGYNAYNNATMTEEDRLMQANIEALSNDGEASGSLISCYTSFSYEYGSAVVDCSTCKTRENSTDKWYNLHDYCTVE